MVVYNINSMSGKFKYLNDPKIRLKTCYKILTLVGLFLAIFASIIGFERACRAEIPRRYVVVEKAGHRVKLYENGRVVAMFPCSLGLDAVSPKRARGDFATPEGLYFVRGKHPSKRYYLFVELDYPNLKDILRARWEGRLSEKAFSEYLRAWTEGKTIPGSLGYAIGLHGGGLRRQIQGKTLRDWTHGCIALRNQDMARLYTFVKQGTPVLIYNRKRPLVETLAEIVPLAFSEESWEGRLRLRFPEMDLELELLISGSKNGLRSLQIVGWSLRAERILFYVRDLNGNGQLDPLDTLYSNVKAFPGGYSGLQAFILDELPRRVLNLIQENRKGWVFTDGTHPERTPDAGQGG